MPPACAMAMASGASGDRIHAQPRGSEVELDIAGDRVPISVSPGMTSEWPGWRSTSSKVSASAPVEVSMIFRHCRSFKMKTGAEPHWTAPTQIFPFRIGSGWYHVRRGRKKLRLSLSVAAARAGDIDTLSTGPRRSSWAGPATLR